MLEKLSVPEQVAAHLRGELMRRRWTGTMPGRDKLARDLGVHGGTIEQGHRRIVMMTRTQLVESELGLTERTFVQELKRNHLPVSTYNLAVWDNSPSGLKHCLDKLFEVTPPTAILVDDWMIYNAIQHYLFHARGIDLRKVSCISMDYHPSFSLYQPQALHFYWDPLGVVQAAVAWVKNVGRGKITVAQKPIEA